MNWVKTCFILLFLSLNSVFCVTDTPKESTDDPGSSVVIPTSSGYIRGVRIPTKTGFFVDYFKGVPFADKPERLRKSKLVRRWNNVYNAQKYPPKCIPVTRPVNASEYSEDCLYLNVLKPSGLNTINKLPVVVFIHGGGFQEGDGNDASCEAFAENFVSKGMVVITIQYRLAMLGFLSLGCTDPLIPCNLGLWDMVTAFQFINKTILDFNGDINNMTLMGHSAGAMAVSLHSISPISSIYFKKYIQLSASSWSLTRFKSQNVEVTQRILHELNCDISSAQKIFECVNSTSLDSMYSAQVNTNLWPEFGDDLLPDIPDNLVNNTKDQKVLMGVMTLESLYSKKLICGKLFRLHAPCDKDYEVGQIRERFISRKGTTGVKRQGGGEREKELEPRTPAVENRLKLVPRRPFILVLRVTRRIFPPAVFR